MKLADEAVLARFPSGTTDDDRVDFADESRSRARDGLVEIVAIGTADDEEVYVDGSRAGPSTHACRP
jgi:hypothetical protein